MELTFTCSSNINNFPLSGLFFAVFNYTRNINYRPFFILIFCGALAEAITTILSTKGLHTMIVWNVLILLQFFLYVFQLVKWGFLRWKFIPTMAAFIVLCIVWSMEFIVIGYNKFNDYSLAFSSFILAIYFTSYLNALIFEKQIILLKDTRFLISVGALIYFAVTLIVFIFYNNSLNLSGRFKMNIWLIHNTINIFTNIIFAFALLWIPSK